jgi:MFS family permease
VRRAGLFRDPDFTKVWAGQSISLIGSAVTQLALPLVAVLTLSATPTQMGVLTAAQTAPLVVVGLLAGVWVDRLRRRPLMIFCDVVRAGLLGSIPAAALTGVVRLEHLYAVAFLAVTFSAIFNIAASAFLPVLVGRDRLVEANSRLVASESLAEVAGPPLAGTLVQLLTAPLAVALDACSFLFSAVTLVLVHMPEPAFQIAKREKLVTAIGKGIRFVLHQSILRALAATAATGNFFAGMIAAVYVLYAVHELGLSPPVIGAISAVGSIGGLAGAVAAGRVVERFGVGRSMVGVAALMGLGSLLLPTAGGPLVVMVPILVAAWLLRGLALPVFNITLGSLRQAMTPDALQGRVNATSRVMAGAAARLVRCWGACSATESACGRRSSSVVWGLPWLVSGLSCRRCAECSSLRHRFRSQVIGSSRGLSA